MLTRYDVRDGSLLAFYDRSCPGSMSEYALKVGVITRNVGGRFSVFWADTRETLEYVWDTSTLMWITVTVVQVY